MKTFRQKQGAFWLLTVFSSIGFFWVYSLHASLAMHTTAMMTGLVVWLLLAWILDQEAPVAGPILGLVFAGAAFLWIFGYKAIPEVVRHWNETPDTYFAASDCLIFLGMMVLSLVLMYMCRYGWTRVLTAVLILAAWILASLLEVQIPKLAVILQIPLLLYTLIELLHIRSREQSKNAHAIVGVVCLFSLILAVLPVSQEPYPYKLLHRVWDGMEELWEKLETQLRYRSKGGTEFSMDFYGAETQETPGRQPADKKTEHEMRVWLDFGDTCVVYLPGTTLDHYDGQVWSRQVDDSRAGDLLNWNYDTAEHIYALWRMDRANGTIPEQSDVFRRRRLEIAYENMDTRTLFTAAGLLRIQTDEERFPFTARAGSVRFNYAQKHDSLYTMFFLQENAGPLAALIEASEGYTYHADQKQSWGQVSGDYAEQFLLKMLQTVQIEESLAARTELIRDTYLQLPEDLSPEVQALALSITADCESDYEKLRAIEAYLQQHFTYSRHPGRPGRGEDLLEHLLETKEGYCTWFATASAILLRANGIPSRYVQGYRTVQNGQTRVRLHDSDAHAWSEGYIQGYGWVVVEGTPGFGTTDSAWEERDLPEEEAAEEEPVEEAEEETVTPSTGRHTGRSRAWLWILGSLLAVLAGLLLAWMQHRKKVYERLSLSGRCRADLQLILRRLRKRGYVRYPYESIRTFFGRIYWQDLGMETETVQDVLKIYEDVLFGDRPVTEEQWHKSRDLADRLKKKKRRHGR